MTDFPPVISRPEVVTRKRKTGEYVLCVEINPWNDKSNTLFVKRRLILALLPYHIILFRMMMTKALIKANRAEV